jgi:hypothetical protein
MQVEQAVMALLKTTRCRYLAEETKKGHIGAKGVVPLIFKPTASSV